MAWIMTQDQAELVDVVSIQLSAPVGGHPVGPYGLIGICLNKQLHSLGLFATREGAQKEMQKFTIWLGANRGFGVYPISQDKEQKGEG